jgi:hypothetical protein
MDNVLPARKKSNTEQELPRAARLKADKVLPRRMKERTEHVEPIDM